MIQLSHFEEIMNKNDPITGKFTGGEMAKLSLSGFPRKSRVWRMPKSSGWNVTAPVRYWLELELVPPCIIRRIELRLLDPLTDTQLTQKQG